ncbi:FecR family protein [Castellaniella hirudinis]|uniref:FecR family protein n=1 Tax=Castellaniella hirudinis TaxID=1144617 RepID=UPI0039C2FDD1
MPVPPPSTAADHPRDAAQWFARMQSGEATGQDRQAFDAWLSANPAHGREYQRLRFLWDATLLVPQERLRGMLAQNAPVEMPPRTGLSRRRFGAGLAAAGALATVAFGANSLLRSPAATLTVSTRRGERRQWTLPDGSEIHLNTDTLAQVRFFEDLRQVTLQHGEILFQVTADATRPFVVDTGLGQVIVTGTRFNVRREADALQVSVASGAVQLRSGHWWNRSERRLVAGQQLIADTAHGFGDIHNANVGDIIAWQRGKIIFHDMPLAQLVAEMNRYLPHPAKLAARQLGAQRISGVFSIDDPTAMINALPVIAPVRLVHLADGSVRITAQ